MTEIKETTETPSIPMHYVCTLEEARALTSKHEKFWVLDCGCREHYGKGNCPRSRIDVCLLFENVDAEWGSKKREITRSQLEEMLWEAENKFLVARPFREEKIRSYTQGICFCCDCCCGYFRGEDYSCDKGMFTEATDMDSCTHCGECVDVCYFKARTMDDGEHTVDREKCYGCGLCVDVCPEECIEMIKRY